MSGTYDVYFGSSAVVLGASTRTGWDLPPGRYRLVLHYRSLQGGERQKDVDVVLP